MAVEIIYVYLALAFALVAAAVGAFTKWSIFMFLSGVIIFAVVVPIDSVIVEHAEGTQTTSTGVTVSNFYSETDFSGDVNLGDDAEGLAEIRAEFIDEPSALIGESLTCMTFDIKVTGSPSGTITAGVFSSTGSTLKALGNIDASEIGTTYETRKFCLTSPDFIILEAGHRVGVKFAGGDASNDVQLKGSGDDLFDDTSTRHQFFYLGDWGNESGDLTMVYTTQEVQTVTEVTDVPVIQAIEPVFRVLIALLGVVVIIAGWLFFKND